MSRYSNVPPRPLSRAAALPPIPEALSIHAQARANWSRLYYIAHTKPSPENDRAMWEAAAILGELDAAELRRTFGPPLCCTVRLHRSGLLTELPPMPLDREANKAELRRQADRTHPDRVTKFVPSIPARETENA